MSYKPNPDRQLGWSTAMLSGAIKLLDTVVLPDQHAMSEITRAKQMLTAVNRKAVYDLMDGQIPGAPSEEKPH